MMGRAFDELHYRRHAWKRDALHVTSPRTAERFGFTYEGIFRLAPANSDAAGQRRQTLAALRGP